MIRYTDETTILCLFLIVYRNISKDKEVDHKRKSELRTEHRIYCYYRAIGY